jgi:transposase
MRDHLSALSAISPEGMLCFHCQEQAIGFADVVAFLEYLLREVPGRLLLLWNGAPIHCSHPIKALLANGAAERLHGERLPACPQGLNPVEGLWAHLTEVEPCNVC